MQNPTYLIDYERAIAALVRRLPMERAAQLYDFARFLVADDGADDLVSDEELAAEDLDWEMSLRRHADRFAALKAQAKADVSAYRTAPMFNERGEFVVE
ncbi:MAG: hypothetical protein K1X65_16195 [Caldilineales bacterium]|nr:hypothetical protein [Caldilineales bacterium]MCW5857184.1 hypothetical protein [Caldilineales bacterium]